MIEFQEVTKYFGNRIVFDQVSCHFQKGAFYCIHGGLSSGKSTFLHMIINQVMPDGGEILFLQQSLRNFRGSQLTLHRKRIGYIDQRPQFLMDRNAEKNIRLFAEIAGQSSSEINLASQTVAEQLGIDYLLKSPIHSLSSSERQLIQIARVLVSRPSLILADEPSQFSDQVLAQQLQALFYEKIYQFGVTVIIATHQSDLWKHPQLQHFILENRHIEALR